MLRSWNCIFLRVSIFDEDPMNLSFHGNQMEPNGTFWENSKYDYWILHKKLVLDETITIIHILTHIS